MVSITLNDVSVSRAVEAFNRGDIEEAQSVFLNILDNEPANPDALYFMGIIDHQSGRSEVAEHRAKTLVDLKPDDGKAINLLGNIQMALGKLSEAEETFDNGILADKTNATLRVSTAICKIGLNQPRVAIDRCKEAVILKPGYANAHNIMGTAFLASGEAANAVAAFEQALELTPQFFDAEFNLGVALLEKNSPQDARRRFENVLSNHPDHKQALSRMGDALAALGKHDEAESWYRKALQIDSAMPVAHTGLGKLLQKLDRQEDALAHFKLAIQANPNNVEAIMHAGDAFRRLGKYEAAAAAFRDVLAIDSGYHQAQYLLAAVEGNEPPNKPDNEYVRRLFDEFADTFDQSLASVEYNAPELLAALALRLTEHGSLRILDLGCGTGQAGVQFRQLAGHLKGVDISSRMLDSAKARGIYDELEANELLHALVRHQNDFDIVVSADVFPYIGDLESVFMAVTSALRPGGLFLLTVETHSEDAEYRLGTTARYSHSRGYLEALARRRGLEVLSCDSISYRKEAGEPIDSLIVALRKPA